MLERLIPFGARWKKDSVPVGTAAVYAMQLIAAIVGASYE